MKTVKDVARVELKYTKGELLEGKWLPYVTVSKKLRALEHAQDMAYRDLTNRLYNSYKGSKYNMAVISGFNCLDAKNPMKTTPASLELTLVETDDE